MSGVPNGTMISQKPVQFPVSREELGSMEGAARQDSEGTLRAKEA